MENIQSTGEYWQEKLEQETKTGAVNAQFKSSHWKKRAPHSNAPANSHTGAQHHSLDKPHAPSGHDEGTWIFSYADMITILMMFFILLLSISNVSPQKFKALQESIQKIDKSVNAKENEPPKDSQESKSGQGGKTPSSTSETSENQTAASQEVDINKLSSLATSSPENREAQTLKAAAYLLSTISTAAMEKGSEIFEDLKKKIKEYSSKVSKMNLTTNKVLIKASLPAKLVFDEKMENISPDGLKLFQKMVANLQPNITKVNIQIGVHLSRHQPVDKESYSLRDADTARRTSIDMATQIFQIFVQNGLDPERLSASGYGFYKPLFSERNNRGLISKSATQGNSRVELIIERKAGDKQ